MSFDTSWDVDKYKCEHEYEEHWQFRRSFLIAHKMKYPESRLVSLAQTFFNVEYLGCSYPQETMDLIENLSKGLVEDLREKRKTKVQRTFVAASNIAKAKAKGNAQTAIQMINNSGQKVEESILSPYDSEYILCGFMLVLREKTEKAAEIIDRSCIFSNISRPVYTFSCLAPAMMQCELHIEHKLIASGSGPSKKLSKKDAATAAFDILKKKCFIIQEKEDEQCDHVAQISLVNKDDSESLNTPDEINDTDNKTKLPENNIGNKILKMMGWQQGCGLGKNGQGRLDPIEVVQLPKNLGLGGSKKKSGKVCTRRNMGALKTEIQAHVHTFLESSKKRLTFSTEFSKEERKMIHLYCIKVGLKSKSYGRGENRHMFVSKKQNSREIFHELINNDCENDCYILKRPAENY